MSEWRIKITGPNGAEGELILEGLFGPKAVAESVDQMATKMLALDPPPSGDGETRPHKEPGKKR